MEENKKFVENAGENSVKSNETAAKISVEGVRASDNSGESEKNAVKLPVALARTTGIINLCTAFAFFATLVGVCIGFFTGMFDSGNNGSDLGEGIGYVFAVILFVPAFLILFLPTSIVGIIWNTVTGVRIIKMVAGKAEPRARSKKMSVWSGVVKIVSSIFLILGSLALLTLMTAGNVPKLIFLVIALWVLVALIIVSFVLESVLSKRLEA